MKKAIAITFAAIGGALVVLLVIAGILSATGYKPPGARPAASPATSAPAGIRTAAPETHTAAPAAHTTTAAPAITRTRTVVRVLFSVTGTGAPSITYGSDSDNLSPDGHLGPLGDGNALPWHASVPYDRNALYYDVSAQLEGSGDIRCTLSLKVTRYYSDGTHISRSKIVQRGHAAGGYNICDAQANS